MKWKDWYLAAAFTALFWAACAVLVIVLGLAAGVPMLIVSHVINILSLFVFMLALLFVAIGAGIVVSKDLLKKVGI